MNAIFLILCACSDAFDHKTSLLDSAKRILGDQPPPLSDRDRFPPAWACAEHLRFNRLHAGWLEQRFLMDPAYAPWIRENDALNQIWWDAHAVKADWWTTWEKREALLRLKKALGEDYWTGDMPPPVPIWRFEGP